MHRVRFLSLNDEEATDPEVICLYTLPAKDCSPIQPSMPGRVCHGKSCPETQAVG